MAVSARLFYKSPLPFTLGPSKGLNHCTRMKCGYVSMAMTDAVSALSWTLLTQRKGAETDNKQKEPTR